MEGLNVSQCDRIIISFTIYLIILKYVNSGFNTFNKLERNGIKTYNAYAKGYNKIRGIKDRSLCVKGNRNCILREMTIKMDELIKKIIPEILLKLYNHFKNGGMYCSQDKIKIGLLSSDEIEQYHSFFELQNNILQEADNTLIIGSPYLKYWFETQDEPRMIRFLRNTRYIKVSVILYNNMDENVQSGLEVCKNKFSDRFCYKIISESSSISYIFYKFKIGNRIYSRCIVGFQKTNYIDRPFIEFVSRQGEECKFVNSIVSRHNDVINNRNKF